jgi:signal transduction histidine kinase
LFGLLPEQTFVSTEDVIRLVHPEDLQYVRSVIESARTVEEFDMEFRVIHPDGTVRWLYDRAKCQAQLPGRIFVGACSDVTQRKLAEDTLRRTEKLAIVGRMASSISHEINNPLAAVTNLMYLIECADSLEEVRAFSATAEQELARVSQIVTQTLRFHRSAAKPTRFDIAALLDSAIALFEPHIAASGVRIHKHVQPDVFIFGNDGELRQVFLNLIGNAIDAIRGSGNQLVIRERVRTDARTGVRGVRIVIADNGHGMAQSTARRIFEPFFSTKGESGTGLGLWISEEIVRKHKGRIRVRSSQSPTAHGTTFSVFLPIVESEKPSGAHPLAVPETV